MRRYAGIAIIFPVVVLLAVTFGSVSAQQTFGTNWTATYFNSVDLTGPVVATQVGLPGVNFNWGQGSPVPGAVNVDMFSVRFTSTQMFQQGTYEFTLTSDDGARMLIDGARVLDEFVPRPLTTNVFTLPLTPGSHSLTVEYFEDLDQASISVSWRLITPGGFIGGTPFPFPGATPGTPVPAGPQAQVVGVQGLAVRTGPYLGATIVTVARPGSNYAVMARNEDEGVFTWYKLQVGSNIGWSSGRFLELTVDPNTIPEEATIFENPEVRDRGVTAIPRAVMNLRRRPSIRTEIIGQVGWGEVVPLLGRTLRAGESEWLLVQQGDQRGWIFAPFVTVKGPVAAVRIF